VANSPRPGLSRVDPGAKNGQLFGLARIDPRTGELGHPRPIEAADGRRLSMDYLAVADGVLVGGSYEKRAASGEMHSTALLLTRYPAG
jgi:hypothetical protein